MAVGTTWKRTFFQDRLVVQKSVTSCGVDGRRRRQTNSVQFPFAVLIKWERVFPVSAKIFAKNERTSQNCRTLHY
jgi:hypothetical protein